jgi:hypothetical protein
MICPTGKVKYFFNQDWTVESALIGLEKFDFWRKTPALRKGPYADFRTSQMAEAWLLSPSAASDL